MLYEAMMGIGEGVLIALGLLIAYVLAVILIDAARARRERRDDEARARRIRGHGVTAIALLLLFFTACTGDEDPTGPIAAISPSPSPSPTPDPKTDVNSCVQTDLRVTGYNGAGNPDVIFGVGELFVVQAHPLNEAGAVLPSACRASTFATWLVSGTAPCQQFGDQFALAAYFWCLEPGTLNAVVTHGRFRTAWAGRIIR